MYNIFLRMIPFDVFETLSERKNKLRNDKKYYHNWTDTITVIVREWRELKEMEKAKSTKAKQ